MICEGELKVRVTYFEQRIARFSAMYQHTYIHCPRHLYANTLAEGQQLRPRPGLFHSPAKANCRDGWCARICNSEFCLQVDAPHTWRSRYQHAGLPEIASFAVYHFPLGLQEVPIKTFGFYFFVRLRCSGNCKARSRSPQPQSRAREHRRRLKVWAKEDWKDSVESELHIFGFCLSFSLSCKEFYIIDLLPLRRKILSLRPPTHSSFKISKAIHSLPN